MSDTQTVASATTAAIPAVEKIVEKPKSSESKKPKGEITPEYVEILRAENKERRAEAEMLNKKLVENEEFTKKALDEVRSLNAQAEQKMIRADVKVFANKYNLRDLEDIKLADLSNVKIDSNGDVHGVEEAIQDLKAKKPYLFGEVSTSRPDFGAVMPAENTYKNKADEVMKMSREDYKRHEQEYLASIRKSPRY